MHSYSAFTRVASALHDATSVNFKFGVETPIRTAFTYLFAFSFFSVGSLFSVGSTLSFASSFSLLSIGSHQSILSIGCNNRLFTVCNWEKYTISKAVEHVSSVHIDRVNSSQCGDQETAVHFSIRSGSAADYEVCSADEETALTCTNGTELNGENVCLSEEDTEKDQTLFVQTKTAPKQVQAVAHMLPRYEYNRVSNYEVNYYEIKKATIIFNDANAWDDISNCTYEEKDEDICDWKDAVCIFDDYGEQKCKAKRKGNASWRDIDKKPSMKVKWSDNGHDKQYKITFNNNVQEAVGHAQVKAYGKFQAAGIPVPRAHSMLLRFGPSIQSVNAYLEYTQVEEIDEVEFLGARALDGASVFELDYWDMAEDKCPINQIDVDTGPTAFKLGPVEEDDASLLDLQRVFTAGASLREIWSVVNQTNFFLWYAGLLATAHYDSGCTRSVDFFNNVYVVKPFFSNKYIFVPWGTDQTMKCSFGDYFKPSYRQASCYPMISCFKNRQCSNEYKKITKDVPKLCGTEHVYLYINISATLTIVLVRKLCCAMYGKKSEKTLYASMLNTSFVETSNASQFLL